MVGDMQDFDVYIVDLYITCGGKAVNIKWRVDKTYMNVQMSELRRDALPLNGDADNAPQFPSHLVLCSGGYLRGRAPISEPDDTDKESLESLSE
jgi:hypothetical protein